MSVPAVRRTVLVVLKSDGVGGVERFLSGMIPALRAQGVDAELVCHGRPPREPGLLGGEALTSLSAGGLPGLLGRVRQGLALRRQIERGDYEAVIGFGPVANGLVALARRGGGPPVVLCERGNPFIEKRRAWNRWFGRVYGRADVLLVQTEACAEELRASWRSVPPVMSIVSPVPAAVPIRRPSADRGQTIAAVGRLVPMKGLADLIEALARLGPKAADWSLLVIGDGPARGELATRAERLGLGDRVAFVGTHRSPWECLADASIYVLCSEHEGYPHTLLEAMASGCTVVAADCRFGPAEMIEHEVSGLLYPVGDVGRLAECLEALIADPERRLALARRSTAWAAEQTTDRAVEQWLALLDDLGARVGVRGSRS